MKKHLLLTFIALFTLCMGAWAETYSGNCGQTKSSYVTWNLDTETGVLRISGTNDGIMKNYHTKNNKAPWYNYKDKITTLIIEEGVKEIGEFAFGDCSSITEISFPSSLTYIYAYAFHKGNNIAVYPK